MQWTKSFARFWHDVPPDEVSENDNSSTAKLKYTKRILVKFGKIRDFLEAR